MLLINSKYIDPCNANFTVDLTIIILRRGHKFISLVVKNRMGKRVEEVGLAQLFVYVIVN